jgi:hypothetical protein
MTAVFGRENAQGGERERDAEVYREREMQKSIGREMQRSLGRGRERERRRKRCEARGTSPARCHYHIYI